MLDLPMVVVTSTSNVTSSPLGSLAHAVRPSLAAAACGKVTTHLHVQGVATWVHIWISILLQCIRVQIMSVLHVARTRKPTCLFVMSVDCASRSYLRACFNLTLYKYYVHVQNNVDFAQNVHYVPAASWCTVFVIYCASNLHVFQRSFDAQLMTSTVQLKSNAVHMSGWLLSGPGWEPHLKLATKVLHKVHIETNFAFLCQVYTLCRTFDGNFSY